jgi:hypothetical protein
MALPPPTVAFAVLDQVGWAQVAQRHPGHGQQIVA